VALIDQGQSTELAGLLAAHPYLLSATAEEDGSFAGMYFAAPKLLWFVAENPIRNRTLPSNIADVVTAIVSAASDAGTEDLVEQLNTTLSLTVSGLVAREAGVLEPLVEALVTAGADAAGAVRAALSHAQEDAVRVLLDKGAPMSLEVAAGLGLEAELQAQFDESTAQQRDDALLIAAICGQPTTTRILLDKGANPNRYGSSGLAAHATPLHMAVMSRSESTVTALITRNADPTLQDKIWSSTPRQWAEHEGRVELAALLRQAGEVLPAIAAIRSGDVEALRCWLQANPDRVDTRIGDNPRTLLHHATDWPGHWPRGGESIAALVSAGASVDGRLHGDTGETALHWAASSDDLPALHALLAGGATVELNGGCILDGTPLMLAVIFANWRAAEVLLGAGARIVSIPNERFRESLDAAPSALRGRLTPS